MSRLWDMLNDLKSAKYTWVDLSHPVNKETPHYSGYNTLEMYEVFTHEEHTVCASEYKIVSQYGTHIDPPSHFVENGRTLDQIELKEMVLPLCIVDLSEKTTTDHDYAFTVEDLKNWESQHGELPDGCFVAIRTNWSQRQGEAFFNPDKDGQPHYPGWSIEALKFLCEERSVTAVGHETPDTDPAIANLIVPWAGERYLLEQDKYQIEMLRNLDQLPETGAVISCSFPNVTGAPGYTARCIAIYEN
ncbi:metal-dependent hydrolase [Enterococcus florum]|uniref:Metal-dependent hydrolase n=1 Tax=Enterococcus florum TaxID=2480627 RepID=A0A4P5P755_9ENTE|nr:cyclase family protein [Enterococcus florum]GCF93620.1 metal-dependent hydrolase [Enterococcus florum]